MPASACCLSSAERGIATAVRKWEIEYARSYGFERILTYCRKSNTAIIRINEKAGFRFLREIPDCWEEPDEPGLVLEFTL